MVFLIKRYIANKIKIWPYRLSVRTHPSQGWKRSSILRRVTATKNSHLLGSFLLRGEATGHVFRHAEAGSANTLQNSILSLSKEKSYA